MACLETVKLKSNGLEDGSVFDESLNEWHLMPRNGGMRVTEDKGSWVLFSIHTLDLLTQINQPKKRCLTQNWMPYTHNNPNSSPATLMTKTRPFLSY